MPALFLGHGSPMNAITPSPEHANWIALGQALPRPRAILVVSAHWETSGASHVTSEPNPRTIHDFGGFPDALFAIQYSAPGDPPLGERVIELLGEGRVRRDQSWGFDHGSWGVVRPMYPDASVPMIQLSLDRSLSLAQHLALAEKLTPLRDEGVLIVASGNVVHNLREYGRTRGTRPGWALDFQARITAAVRAGETAALTDFTPDDAAAAMAINSAEHYLPLLYAAGARLPGDDVGVFNDTVDGALTMTSYLIGDASLLKTLQ
jgi:4,5-DOPA dioxygenase extradiol